jgi:hypothetical protein
MAQEVLLIMPYNVENLDSSKYVCSKVVGNNATFIIPIAPVVSVPVFRGF